MSIDREYKIKITTQADGSGAKDAEDALKHLGTAGKEAGEQGEKSAEGMFEKHHELHKLIHAIGNDAVPGMGHAFAALAMGPLGALTAIALVVEIVKKNIEDTYKKLDALAAESAKAFGGGDALTDYVNATAEAAAETEEFAEAMHKAADAGDAVKNRYEGEAKAIQAAVDALKEKLKLQEDADLAAERNSGASPDVAAATEADIRARYESRSAAVQDAADQALQIARQRELFERQKNDPNLQASAEATLTPARTIQDRNARSEALKAQEALLAKATGDLNTQANDELNEHIENLKGGLEFMRRAGTRAPIVKAREAEIAQLESETAESRKADAEDRIKELSKQVAKDTANAAKEKEARQDAENAATENTKRIVALQKEIAEGNTAAQIKSQSTAELLRNLAGYGDVKTFEKAAGVDTAGGVAQLVEQFRGAQIRLQNHQGTPADQQTIALMNALLQATRQGDQATHTALEYAIQAIVDHKRQTAADMQRLKQLLESKGK
jgi:hypothetical protein